MDCQFFASNLPEGMRAFVNRYFTVVFELGITEQSLVINVVKEMAAAKGVQDDDFDAINVAILIRKNPEEAIAYAEYRKKQFDLAQMDPTAFGLPPRRRKPAR